MRKLLFVNLAVATLAVGALTPDRTEAATLAGLALGRTATEGTSLIEQVARRWTYQRRYGYRNRYRFGYRPYNPPSRYNSRRGGFHYR